MLLDEGTSGTQSVIKAADRLTLLRLESLVGFGANAHEMRASLCGAARVDAAQGLGGVGASMSTHQTVL